MKKTFFRGSALAGVVILALSAVGCASGTEGSDEETQIAYQTYSESTVAFTDNSNPSSDTYNHSLYYRNDLTLDMGDPMLVYDDGLFYAYGTRGGTSFNAFVSTDLATWRQQADAFVPQPGSWSSADLWAPDIQKIGDKWYLYYTANYNGCCQLGVAVADSPAGPFVQFTGVNGNGETIGLDTPAFFWEGQTILDSHVFEDDDGKLYMFFSYDTGKSSDPLVNNGTAEIWGVELIDPVTWDLSTLTRLISAGYKQLSDENRTIEWETWSPSFSGDMECVEGPYMIKQNGKYYLTYCANSYVDTEYAVGYAVADSPLGTYVKPDDTFLQNMICGVPGQTGTYINTRYLGFQTGTGHASICKVGDEYLLAYHAHYNRDKWGALRDEYGEKSEWRALGVDYLLFDEEGMPYTNGPTWSLVRLPEAVTGYENLALQATFTIQGENVQYLNDNFTNRAYRTEEVVREAQFKAGTRSVEIKFDTPVSVRAINIVNSYDYSKKTDFISQIDFGEGRGIVNVLFNQRYLNKEQSFIFPHAAYNVELEEELVTDRIVITFESDIDFAVGEIEVIGRTIS